MEFYIFFPFACQESLREISSKQSWRSIYQSKVEFEFEFELQSIRESEYLLDIVDFCHLYQFLLTLFTLGTLRILTTGMEDRMLIALNGSR